MKCCRLQHFIRDCTVSENKIEFQRKKYNVSFKLEPLIPQYIDVAHGVATSKRNDVAHSIGVQNVVLPFFCLQEPIYNVLVTFFCFETRGVRLPC